MARDGVCGWLPDKLPEQMDFEWVAELPSAGIGGICATTELVIAGSRDITDASDVFTCLDLADGSERWQIIYPTFGETLDYGNSPRATPVVVDDLVVLLGAFGQLTVAEIQTGAVVWQVDYQIEFGSEVPIWGFSGTPLIFELEIDGELRKLVLAQPGTPEASLAAFDLLSGEIVWQVAGNPAGYSSFIVAEIKGEKQLIGYDATTAGGWDLNGNRLWELVPEHEGDFNVPTPMILERGLLLSTENNGTRLFEFDVDGTPLKEPVAVFPQLSPDTHTPVVIGDAICGIDNGFYCIDGFDLTLLSELKNRDFSEYCSAITDGHSRVLCVSQNGAIVLVKVESGTVEIAGRLESGVEVISHPAVSGHSLLIRLGESIVCINLEDGA